jgi:chromosome segregation ATPase
MMLLWKHYANKIYCYNKAVILPRLMYHAHVCGSITSLLLSSLTLCHICATIIVKELKDSRELTRTAHELKFQVDQLTLAGRNLQDDVKEAKREAEEAKRQLAAAVANGANGNGIASPSSQNGNGAAFEAEREAYHAEIKKLRDHVTELHAARTSAAAAAAQAPPPEQKTNAADIEQYVERIRVYHHIIS